MAPSARDVVRSYRRLYRQGLRAVQYSAPARYILRDEIRHAYRKNRAADFNAESIENTVEFFRSATTEKGWAHRIVKNLVHVWWGKGSSAKRKLLNNPSSLSETLLRQRAHEHFNITMAMFNENFGLCLPVRDIHEEEETPASLDRKKSQDYQSMV